MNADENVRARATARVVLAVFALLMCAVDPARAEAPSAEALFKEGRQLLAEGKIAEACAKLEESQRLEPSSGTLMNLAYCQAQLGRTASAWILFLRAERDALAQSKPERAAEARRQATALEPLLPRLTIRAGRILPGMVIRQNGQTLAPAALATSRPVDPGQYSIHASAPGYEPWQTALAITEPGERVVEVPALVARGRPAPRPLRRVERRTGSKRKQAAHAKRAMLLPPREQALPATFWIGTTATAAAAATATAFGILSLSTYARAEEQCPSARQCEPGAVRLEDRSRSQARITNVAWAVAAISAGITAFIYFDSRPSPRRVGVTSSWGGAN